MLEVEESLPEFCLPNKKMSTNETLHVLQTLYYYAEDFHEGNAHSDVSCEL